MQDKNLEARERIIKECLEVYNNNWIAMVDGEVIAYGKRLKDVYDAATNLSPEKTPFIDYLTTKDRTFIFYSSEAERKLAEEIFNSPHSPLAYVVEPNGKVCL